MGRGGQVALGNNLRPALGKRWTGLIVNLAEQRGNRLLVEQSDLLRTVFRIFCARQCCGLETVVTCPSICIASDAITR